MNPKARITYRFEPAKPGVAGKGADSNRNGGRLVRVLPEDDAGRKDGQSPADPVWPGELRFETDVIPWKSPFQDDPDALERLIRETDGQTMETEPGGRTGGGETERGAETGRIRPVPERKPEADDAVPLREPAAGGVARTGGHPADANGGMLLNDWEALIAGEDDAPAGYVAPRRRPPAPSWTRVIATVAGAVLTGALFGYLVMSLLVWQPGAPEQEETGIPPDEEANIGLPAYGVVPEEAGDSPDVSGSPAVSQVPAVRYYVLQYGVFSTEAGLAEALAQLQKAGYAAAADTADGFRAYAGIAESREAAEALAAKLGGVELYVRPLEVPATDPAALEGQPGSAAEFMLRTNDLMRTMSGLSASLLAAGGTNPIPSEAWDDWQTSHRSWTEAAEAVRKEVPAESGPGRISDALRKAAEAFAAYRGKPAPEHLWDVQSALMEAAIAQRDWMRSTGAL
ncbi:sporulation related protein [Thermobacillus composti KWC4]|uniref:Sporulation related protein n=1 Tax=Thermobacillus composti (strain DSM 18247 / JCM 13945 / KWC4) TaxID=717605 RepID=L0EG99_THECK|nr:SPOR domain-containing protein [Thermobacillus composti]AGA58659.1 sporulation related protein [Thermobacillus composti KWC4]